MFKHRSPADVSFESQFVCTIVIVSFSGVLLIVPNPHRFTTCHDVWQTNKSVAIDCEISFREARRDQQENYEIGRNVKDLKNTKAIINKQKWKYFLKIKEKSEKCSWLTCRINRFRREGPVTKSKESKNPSHSTTVANAKRNENSWMNFESMIIESERSLKCTDGWLLLAKIWKVKVSSENQHRYYFFCVFVSPAIASTFK